MKLTFWFHSPCRLYQKASLNPKDTNESETKQQLLVIIINISSSNISSNSNNSNSSSRSSAFIPLSLLSGLLSADCLKERWWCCSYSVAVKTPLQKQVRSSTIFCYNILLQPIRSTVCPAIVLINHYCYAIYKSASLLFSAGFGTLSSCEQRKDTYLITTGLL